jgi:hypothetical protein
MIRLSGRMTPRVIASRSSATFLPEKSSGVRAEAADAALAAPCPALRAPLAAVCCRPRALPPALAARLRAVELPEEDDEELDRRELDEPEPERELVLDRRLLDALDEPDPLREVEDLRALDPELRELDDPEPLRELEDLRALDPELRELDEPEPDRALDFRAPDPEPDPRDVDPELFRDDPPPLPPVVSAISLPPQEARAREPLGPRRTISCPARS